ncbi:MAG: S9 family peptidase [Verrucomicrobia bacterium]|nr:S9 family peptidase [Verrucomicrobiota bacterium]
MTNLQRIKLSLGTVFTLFALASLPTHAAKPGLTHEDLWLLKQPGAPAPSPDGRWVVLPVSEPSYDEKEERANLWILPADGSQPPRKLTTAKAKESAPAWNPNGTQIAFVAKREGDDSAQIYVIPVAGGEARRLTQMTLGARRPVWSPDGRFIAFQGTSFRGAKDEGQTKKIFEERKKAKSKVRIYDGFPIRRWDKWLDDSQTRLFVVDAEGTTTPTDLLAESSLVQEPGFRGPGDEGSSDHLQPAWTRDSLSLVFVATTNFHHAAHAQPVFDLYQVPATGATIRKLTTGAFNAGSPKFTTDGQRLYFLSSADVGTNYYALQRLMSAPWPEMTHPQVVLPRFERSIDHFAILAGGARVAFTAEDSGHVGLWTSAPPGADPVRHFASKRGAWSGIEVATAQGDPVVFGNWGAAHVPVETHRANLTSGELKRLSSFNTSKAQALDWPELREFWFTNKTGRAIHSFLALPPGFEEQQQYPLLVLIHGGHANMWRDAITTRWNYHLLAQPGYVVLLTDYVGSTGYGESFTRAILGDPLRGPAEDLNAAADEAIRRYGFIDGRRQAAAGASYGGHLANWLEATTTRYRCLISHAGLASLYAQWSTSDAIYHRELMMGGPFWDNPKAWLDQSPAAYAASFRTPMLLSIGESDYRVPLNNVVEMWNILQRQKVPGRLLVWPDENHWILKGENSKLFYQEVHAWLARWLKAATLAEP